MAEAFDIKVSGLKELAARLKDMSAELARTSLRRAASAGAAVIRKAARDRAPIGPANRKRRGAAIKPGTLRRAIVSQWISRQSDATQVKFLVTVRRGKNQQKNNRDAFYAAWVEKGHRIVPRKTAKVRGTLKYRRLTAGSRMVGPRPFLGPAFQSSGAAALEAMRARLAAEVDRVAKGGS